MFLTDHDSTCRQAQSLKGLGKTCAKHTVRLFLLITLLLWAVPMHPQAASNASITSCRLTAKTKLAVKISIRDVSKVPGNKVYLFSMPMTQSRIGAGDRPIASASKKKAITLRAKFSSASLQEVLSRRYLAAARQADGSYKAITAFRYITNAAKAAKYTYAFPSAPSKKGLQVNWEMQEDAQELNVHHSVLNIVFTEMLASPDEYNQYASIPFTFAGNTYWFRRSAIGSYDAQLSKLSADGAIISAVLLLGYRSDTLNLIYPGGRETGHNFYAWNTRDPLSRRTFQAMLTFLAQRYSAKSGPNGRIVNWIVGNEVNNYRSWNYGGEHSLSAYADLYANAFRLTYNAVKSVYSNARIYISLDHLWNTKLSSYFTAHEMLDAFAARIRSGGNIQWNLAYHPYGSPLTEPKFWENKNRQTTDSLSSPVINMNNLSLLTGYIREHYGSATRIILSEQGYTSQTSSGSTYKEQAAAIAYSYYVTEAEDQVDSFIMNRHVDHEVETAQGLNLGLWTTSGTESADLKKPSWKVFKYMDTSLSEKVTASYLKVIGAKAWSALVDGFSKALYAKTPFKKGKLAVISSYSGGRKIKTGWKGYGAVTDYRKDGSAMHVIRADGSNKNRLWGIEQTFPKGVSLSKTPVICLTARVDGPTAGRAVLKLRFLGDNRIFECEKAIPAGGNVRLKTSLKGWKGLSKIRKIQIVVSRASGDWSNSSSLTISNIRGMKK